MKDTPVPVNGIVSIPVEEIHPFHDHPFRLYEGERLEDMVQSIRDHGVLNPVIVRKAARGYEMLAGHNRTNAANDSRIRQRYLRFSIYQVLPKLIELWGMNIRTDVEAKKKLHATDRERTTPLFLLRCVQLGISIRDLDLLTIGMVNDMFVESRNDEYKG